MQPALKSEDPLWKGSYIAALFEEDRTKVPALIAQAESEIVGRTRMLFGTPGDNAREVAAMNNAFHMLQALKSCIKAATTEPAAQSLQHSNC